MRKPCLIHSIATLTVSFVLQTSINAQALKATTAPSQNWASLASSADGTKLAAVASYGLLYISTNSGQSWASATTGSNGPEPQRPWTAVSSSADGERLIAVANFVPIFISTNGGVTWDQSGPAALWSAAAISSDGAKAVALDHQGAIYTSDDGEKTWVVSAAPNRRWRSVACSADGSMIFAGTDFGTNYGELPALYRSTNFGVTWELTPAPAQPWQSIACSADGQHVAAGVYGGLVYLSNDAGMTWTAAPLPSSRWGGIAGSTDGTRLITASWEGLVYISNNSGQSWTKADAPAGSWMAVASSADGLHLLAGIWDTFSGGIYEAQFPPVLRIASSPSGTVVSWPNPTKGYVLQENQDISSATWKVVNVTPSVVNCQNQVSLPAANGINAYRLVRTDVAQQITAR